MPPISYLSGGGGGGGGGVVHGETFGPESEPEPKIGQSQNRVLTRIESRQAPGSTMSVRGWAC